LLTNKFDVTDVVGNKYTSRLFHFLSQISVNINKRFLRIRRRKRIQFVKCNIEWMIFFNAYRAFLTPYSNLVNVFNQIKAKYLVDARGDILNAEK